MSRSSAAYGVTLAALLIGSYLSWTHDDDAAESAAVIVLDTKVEDLSKILYTSEKLDLELETRKDDQGPYLWVHSTERIEKRAPPKPKAPADSDEAAGDAADEVAEVAPEIKVIKKVFKAGKSGDTLLEKFAPFEANRLLDAGGDKLAEFGLDAPTETLELDREGKPPRVFEIGGEAYGTRDRYLRDRDSGKVYLVDAAALSPLKRGATSLPDHDLFGIDPDAVARVQVSTTDASLELEHLNRDDKAAAYWRTAGDPEDAAEPNESAAAWLDKVFRLRSASYVQPDESPTDTEVFFAVTAMDDDNQAVTLEVLKGLSPQGEDTWYGRSQYTRELVVLHKSPASQAAEDLSTILE